MTQEDFNEQFKVLLNMLKNCNFVEENKLYEQLGGLEEFIVKQKKLNTPNSKKILRRFYNNNLTSKSLYGIRTCIDYITRSKAKLSMVGVSTEWEIGIINYYVDNRIIFKLNSISNNDIDDLRYEMIPIKCYPDADKEKFMDRIIMNMAINQNENTLDRELFMDHILISNNTNLEKALKLTPATYRYYALNNTSFDSVYPLYFSRFTTKIEYIIREEYMDTLYINYIVEGTLELDSDDLKGINNLNKAIKYNLKHISRSLIKTLQLLNDTENTPTYYHSLDVYDPEKVIQDLVFLNVISQCISDKSIQEAVLSFKGVKDMREKLKSNFSSVTNSAFTGVYGVVSTTRLVCEGYIKIPDSLIEFIKLLATTPMAESVNENSKQVKLKPQFKELSDKVYSVCQDYRAQEYILSNPEN